MPKTKPTSVEEMKKEFDGIFTNLADRYQHHGVYLWEWIESKLKQREEEIVSKVEKVLFTESGFLREDENLAPDILESLKENT